jgi:DNA-binding winged helix-turn-helix (wHTH) protein
VRPLGAGSEPARIERSLARVERNNHDTSPSTKPPPLRVRFDRFEIDEAEARLVAGGEPVHLAPKPFALLCALARAPQALITKSALLDDVWGHQFVSESVLKTTISDLRSALQDDPKQARYIETVSRRGYRFIGTLTDVTKPLAPAPVLKAPGPQNEPLSAAAQDSIGRAKVLARLNTAWGAAAAGRRQVVWVSGEAGVGKTTVVERFMREVGEAHCAYGHCVEQYGAGEPHLPILEALTDLSHRDASLVDLIRAVAPTWLFQLPWLAGAEEREALRRELSGAGQARMLREMGELLDRYTEQRPLLLVTEDLHWSDPPPFSSWTTSRAAARGAAAVARELSRDRAHRRGAPARDGAPRVAPAWPGHGAGARRLLRGGGRGIPCGPRAGAGSRAGAGAALHDRTDGLPLFVAGVIDDLVGHPAPEGDPQARLAAMAIPETLSGVIDRYIQELTPEQRSLLETASVCGVQFRLSTVARVLDVDAMTLADSCAELARRQRWLKDLPLPPHSPLSESGYVFRHALYREVLYKRLGRLSRVDLHRKVAVSLEHERAQGLNVGAAELATHLDLGREPMSACATTPKPPNLRCCISRRRRR